MERPGPIKNLLVAKWSSNAELLWLKELEGMTTKLNTAGALSPDGSIFLGGEGYFTHAIGGAYVMKIDKDGNFLWAVEVSSGQYETSRSLVATPDGGVVVASFHKTGTSNDILLFRLDRDGNLQ